MHKQVNKVVLDTAAVSVTTSAEIGRQPAEIVDTSVAAVVTIATIIVGDRLPNTTTVRADVLVVTVSIVTLMHKVARVVTETAAAMTAGQRFWTE